MGVLGRIDEMGKPAWITLMVLSFILFWPAGLAVLAFLLWSGRMGPWGNRREWRQKGEHAMARCGWHGGRGRDRGRTHTSGNRAFDEYREETLKRLEEEQTEFHEFLERLRLARDKAEFDQFLASRRERPEGSEAPTPA